MLKLRYHTKFKKDYKRAIKRGLNKDLLMEVITKLQNEEPLPAKNHDHELIHYMGKESVREYHIQPDWLLIYAIQKDELILDLLRTGSHSDVF